MGMLYQDCQLFGPKQNCQDVSAIGTHYLKGHKGFASNFTRLAHFS